MTSRNARQGPAPSDPPEDAVRTADRLHAAAIHLLRRLRGEDAASGLSGPRLSALSVIVFGGPVSLTALAAAEQVRPPSMTRLVHELERLGLVERVAHPTDRRSQHLRATAKGKKLLEQGRRRRVAHLAAAIARLTPAQSRRLRETVELLERLARA
jgi:DNA-binding MarR family transcriptional regulator